MGFSVQLKTINKARDSTVYTYTERGKKKERPEEILEHTGQDHDGNQLVGSRGEPTRKKVHNLFLSFFVPSGNCCLSLIIHFAVRAMHLLDSDSQRRARAHTQSKQTILYFQDRTGQGRLVLGGMHKFILSPFVFKLNPLANRGSSLPPCLSPRNVSLARQLLPDSRRRPRGRS